jgi:hypothetical protein
MLGRDANISWRFNAMHSPEYANADLEDTCTSPVKTGALALDGEQTGLAAKRGLNFEEDAAIGDLLPHVAGQSEDPNAMVLDNNPPLELGAREGSEKDRSKRTKKDGVSSNNSRGSADSSKGSVRSQ